MVGLVNPNGATAIVVDFADVPGLGAGPWDWAEFYTGMSGTGSSVSMTLDTHDMAVIKVSKAS